MAKQRVRPPKRGPAPPHPSSATPPPAIPAEVLPQHVAIVMDGNGRWAKQRGLKRTEGHARGGGRTVRRDRGRDRDRGGQVPVGVRFSTENWKRSPDEVRWLMGFNRDVIHRRRDQLDAMGVRIRWAGRRPRLWASVIKELEEAEEQSKDNDVLTLQFCVNYGGRAEIVDAVREIAQAAKDGRLDPKHISEKSFRRYLDEPEIPDVDLFLRSSGEQRTSNFLLWQSAYAEMVFLDTCGPTSTAAICGERSRSTPGGIGASAGGPSRTRSLSRRADTRAVWPRRILDVSVSPRGRRPRAGRGSDPAPGRATAHRRAAVTPLGAPW